MYSSSTSFSCAVIWASDFVSESGYLLRLLGLELLLKCVHDATRTVSRHGHHYEAIFSALPAAMQARLLRLAGERIGPSGLASDAPGVLAEWGRNFIALRYPYEKYEHLSERDYRALGERWVAKLLHPLSRRDGEQAELALTLGKALSRDGFTVRQTAVESGYAIYQVVRAQAGVSRTLKNLICVGW